MPPPPAACPAPATGDGAPVPPVVVPAPDGPPAAPADGEPDPSRLAQGLAALCSGTLGVRLARDGADLDAAQALRFAVFFDEMGARADPAAAASRRDRDRYDAVADHLLVVDHALGDGPRAVVGTYRLIGAGGAARAGGFYSAAEYDLSALLAFPGGLLELGRSCVAPPYRTRGTLQLLWRGIATYVFHHRIGLMFGCASLPGTDLERLAPLLSYLHAHHLAPPALRPVALPGLHRPMDRLDADGLEAAAALADLPPLVKGYLRLGGFVGDGAVVDAAFNTTDVCVVVPTAQVTGKYYRHYERAAPR